MSRPNRGDEERVPPSNHLWVGNLKPETTDSDLIPLFGRYGVLDSVTTYSSRSFAFIYFKRLDDAKAAKEALQGTSLHGSSLKIEFARPVCSHFCDLSLFIGLCLAPGLSSIYFLDYCIILYNLHRSAFLFCFIFLRENNYMLRSNCNQQLGFR